MDDDVQPETTDQEEPKTFPAEYISSLRSECARYRLAGKDARDQVAALEAELKEHKAGPSAELEQARVNLADVELRLADAEIAAAEIEVKNMVTLESFKLGIVDVDKAFELIDLSLIDEDPASAKRALTALIKTNPGLAETPIPPPSPGISNHPSIPPKKKLTENEAWLAMLTGGSNR